MWDSAGKVVLIALVAFFLNLPFGMLRTRYKKFSWKWLLCIHAPIPIVAFLRITTKTHWKFIPVFLATSILGQVVGARLKRA